MRGIASAKAALGELIVVRGACRQPRTLFWTTTCAQDEDLHARRCLCPPPQTLKGVLVKTKGRGAFSPFSQPLLSPAPFSLSAPWGKDWGETRAGLLPIRESFPISAEPGSTR